MLMADQQTAVAIQPTEHPLNQVLPRPSQTGKCGFAARGRTASIHAVGTPITTAMAPSHVPEVYDQRNAIFVPSSWSNKPSVAVNDR